MMETLVLGLGIITLIVLFLLVIFVVILFFQIRKIRGDKDETRHIAPQMAVLGEKLAHIEPVIQTVNALHADIRGLTERIGSVEQNQQQVNQGVGIFATNAISAITELKTLTSNLNDAAQAMRTDLSTAQNNLTELHSHVRAEQETERQIAKSIRRLETIIAGTQSKGSAGENLLEAVFARLPVEWQVRDFRIGGKTVEFALRLPNNLIMPIDSKWTATTLIDQFAKTEDTAEQQRLKKAIEDTVIQKAKEVKKYIDPSITVNFGIAVIPDAVYDLCAGIQPDIFQLNVVLVSYSMFVPYLLLVYQMCLKNSQSIDLHKLDAYLRTAQESLKSLQEELDGRFSKAITMLNNSRDDMRAMLGKANSSLTGLQMGAEMQNPALTEKGVDIYPE